MEKEFIYLAVGITALLSLCLAFLLIYIKWQKEKRDESKLARVELSYMREYFEKQLYDINQKLASDMDRWKDVNHLLLSYKPQVDTTFFNVKSTINDSFFKNFGLDTEHINVRKNLVFVLTPFLKEEELTFQYIKGACERSGFVVVRGDEEFIRGDIFQFILSKLLEARIIIANINGRNPNVFYEMGIAQAIGKPVIIVSEDLEKVPFDIKSQNIILYEKYSELDFALANTLSKVLLFD